MNVNVPSAFTTMVPTPGIVSTVPMVNGPVKPAIVYPVTVKALPSASVSLVSTLPETGLSSVVLTVSSTATGKSFTDVTVMFTTPVSVPPLPSLVV